MFPLVCVRSTLGRESIGSLGVDDEDEGALDLLEPAGPLGDEVMEAGEGAEANEVIDVDVE